VWQGRPWNSSAPIGVYTPYAQTQLEAQRPAMQKLAFLIGDWSGEACVLRGPGQFVDLSQTEHAEFKSSRRE